MLFYCSTNEKVKYNCLKEFREALIHIYIYMIRHADSAFHTNLYIHNNNKDFILCKNIEKMHIGFII